MTADIAPSRNVVLLASEGHWRDIFMENLTAAGYSPEIRKPEIGSFPPEKATSEAYILPVYGPRDPILDLVRPAARGGSLILVLAGSRVNQVGFKSGFEGAAYCIRKSLDFTPVVGWLRDPIGFAERQNRNLR